MNVFIKYVKLPGSQIFVVINKKITSTENICKLKEFKCEAKK